jgi:hypothetical protein
MYRDSGRQLFDDCLALPVGRLGSTGQPSIRHSCRRQHRTMRDVRQGSRRAGDRSAASAAEYEHGRDTNARDTDRNSCDHRNAHDATAHHDRARSQGGECGTQLASSLGYLFSGVSCCFAHATSSFNVCTV